MTAHPVCKYHLFKILSDLRDLIYFFIYCFYSCFLHFKRSPMLLQLVWRMLQHCFLLWSSKDTLWTWLDHEKIITIFYFLENSSFELANIRLLTNYYFLNYFSYWLFKGSWGRQEASCGTTLTFIFKVDMVDIWVKSCLNMHTADVKQH